MSYIGKTPTSVPLTSSDIADGIISTDKLAANAVVTSKITDATISNADVNATLVTGQTAETSIADGDTILIHDASASALRKMTKANFVSGIGGANTPIVRAVPSGNQTISASTNTTVVFNTEIVDTNSAFTSNTFTVPSGKAGKYFVSVTLITNTAADDSLQRFQVKRNINASGADANVLYANYRIGGGSSDDNTKSISGIVELAEADTLRVNYYSYQQGSYVKGNSEYVGGSSFNIFKLI